LLDRFFLAFWHTSLARLLSPSPLSFLLEFSACFVRDSLLM